MITLRSIKDKSKPKNKTYFNTNRLKKNRIIDQSFSDHKKDITNYISVFDKPISKENNVLVKINEFLYNNAEPDETLTFEFGTSNIQSQQDFEGPYKISSIYYSFTNARQYVDFTGNSIDHGLCPDCDMLDTWSTEWYDCLSSCEVDLEYGAPANYFGLSCEAAKAKLLQDEKVKESSFEIVSPGKYNVSILGKCYAGWLRSYYMQEFQGAIPACDWGLISAYEEVGEDCTKTFVGGKGWSIAGGKGYSYWPHTVNIHADHSTYRQPLYPTPPLEDSGQLFTYGLTTDLIQRLGGEARAVVFPAKPPGVGKSKASTAMVARIVTTDRNFKTLYYDLNVNRDKTTFKTCRFMFGVEGGIRIGLTFVTSYPVAFVVYDTAYLYAFPKE